MEFHKLTIRGGENGVHRVLLDGQRLYCTTVEFRADVDDDIQVPRVTLTLYVSDLDVDAAVLVESETPAPKGA